MKGTCTAVKCDASGTIEAVIRDDLGLTGGLAGHASLAQLGDRESRSKLLSYLVELKQRGILYDWEIHAPVAGQIVTLHCAGSVVDGGYLILICRTAQDLWQACQEMLPGFGEVPPGLRPLAEKQAAKAARTGHDYDDLSSLGNELVAQVRALAKENARLRRSGAEDRMPFSAPASETASYERLRDFARGLILERGGERQRISDAIHDDIGQQLSAVGIGLDLLQKTPDVEAGALGPWLAELSDITRRSARQLRDLALELALPGLGVIELNPALEGLCHVFAEQTGLSVAYMGSQVDGLSREAELCLYRFLEEGLRNVAEHAEAANVWVTLTEYSGTIVLSIEDDGRGFDPEMTLAAIPGMSGLRVMREYLALLMGHLEIDSRCEKGTYLQAYLPGPSLNGERANLAE